MVVFTVLRYICLTLTVAKLMLHVTACHPLPCHFSGVAASRGVVGLASQGKENVLRVNRERYFEQIETEPLKIKNYRVAERISFRIHFVTLSLMDIHIDDMTVAKRIMMACQFVKVGDLPGYVDSKDISHMSLGWFYNGRG